jgi:hypothetical protein
VLAAGSFNEKDIDINITKGQLKAVAKAIASAAAGGKCKATAGVDVKASVCPCVGPYQKCTSGKDVYSCCKKGFVCTKGLGKKSSALCKPKFKKGKSGKSKKWGGKILKPTC